MAAVLQTLKSTLADFTNVFGRSPKTVVPRLRKGLSVLFGMIRGGDLASSRGPIRIQVEVTDKCNFDCIMCNRLTRPNVTFKLANDIDHTNFVRLLDWIDPFYVTLNGLGEPALNKSIDKILIECRSRGIRTQMPSNMSIKKVVLEKIVPNPPEILTFSMHGATKESFEAVSVNSTFEDCIELFEAFLAKIDRNEVEVRILCALQAKNLTEYAGFYEYLSKWNLLNKFVLVPVYDYGTGGGEERRVLPSAAEIETALGQIDRDIAACTDAGKLDFMQVWRDSILQIRPAEQIVETGPCLVPWFSTYITAKGKVLPCCFLTDEDHVLGNIHEQDFPSIWNGPKYREFRHQLREGRGQLTSCRTCPRNDAGRIRKYNPLSLVPTKWHLNGTGGSNPQLPGASHFHAASGAVAVTINGRTIEQPDRKPV